MFSPITSPALLPISARGPTSTAITRSVTFESISSNALTKPHPFDSGINASTNTITHLNSEIARLRSQMNEMRLTIEQQETLTDVMQRYWLEADHRAVEMEEAFEKRMDELTLALRQQETITDMHQRYWLIAEKDLAQEASLADTFQQWFVESEERYQAMRASTKKGIAITDVAAEAALADTFQQWYIESEERNQALRAATNKRTSPDEAALADMFQEWFIQSEEKNRALTTTLKKEEAMTDFFQQLFIQRSEEYQALMSLAKKATSGFAKEVEMTDMFNTWYLIALARSKSFEQQLRTTEKEKETVKKEKTELLIEVSRLIKSNEELKAALVASKKGIRVELEDEKPIFIGSKHSQSSMGSASSPPAMEPTASAIQSKKRKVEDAIPDAIDRTTPLIAKAEPRPIPAVTENKPLFTFTELNRTKAPIPAPRPTITRPIASRIPVLKPSSSSIKTDFGGFSGLDVFSRRWGSEEDRKNVGWSWISMEYDMLDAETKARFEATAQYNLKLSAKQSAAKRFKDNVEAEARLGWVAEY